MEDLGDRHRAPWDVPEWGKESSIDIDLSVATSEQQLLRTSAEDRKEVFFYALKKGNKHAIRNLLRFDRTIVNEQLYGFEGADVYESVTGSHSQRCCSRWCSRRRGSGNGRSTLSDTYVTA